MPIISVFGAAPGWAVSEPWSSGAGKSLSAALRNANITFWRLAVT
jgi:hypothetical protein